MIGHKDWKLHEVSERKRSFGKKYNCYGTSPLIKLWQHLLWGFWKTDPRPWLLRRGCLGHGWVWTVSRPLLKQLFKLLCRILSQHRAKSKKFAFLISSPLVILMWKTGLRQEKRALWGYLSFISSPIVLCSRFHLAKNLESPCDFFFLWVKTYISWESEWLA